MESIKTCMPENFKHLKLKIYRNFLRALLKATIKKLSDYATVVYLTLYDLAEASFWYPGTVVISHQTPSREIRKSKFSARRAINILKEPGFLELKPKNHPEKNYLPKHKNKKIRILLPIRPP